MLHSYTGIQNFSLSFKKYFTVITADKWNIFQQWNEIPDPFTFATKGTIYCVSIVTVSYSHVKITSCYINVRRYHVCFHWCYIIEPIYTDLRIFHPKSVLPALLQANICSFVWQKSLIANFLFFKLANYFWI